MLRIAGINLPNEKKIVIALTYIFGIGESLSNKIIQEIKINPNKRTYELSEEEIDKLREIIEKQYRVEGDLKREIMFNIKRLKENGSYRGNRHIKSLPVRGQRTKTNSRTVRGNVRHIAMSGKKLVAQKT
ncbi:MAG: 30S ribosomal protein S13 [Xanthomonadaceae bacterium]|nr:30S ribosomal protein S13 [Rhodospirillaceae bacterium]NIA17930.1 30S ribosomal protein S13 [Xanthomonadaceae bacterium]